MDQIRSAKYLLPARADARLPPLFLNGARHPLHYDFLVEVFPELFPTLTPKDYLRLLFDAEVRELVVGSVTQYRRREGGKRWGFTISGDPAQPGFITCDDVRAVHGELKRRLPDARDLGVAPSDQQQLADFPNCGVPFIDPGDVAYEAYHRAAAFGTVRRFRGPELAFAVEQAEVGFRDLVVVDEAPSDIETVVSAVVTGTRQGPLSHVAVRSAARGTPNCYVEGAYESCVARCARCGPRSTTRKRTTSEPSTASIQAALPWASWSTSAARPSSPTWWYSVVTPAPPATIATS